MSSVLGLMIRDVGECFVLKRLPRMIGWIRVAMDQR